MKFAKRMERMQASEIRELLKLTAQPDIINTIPKLTRTIFLLPPAASSALILQANCSLTPATLFCAKARPTSAR